MRKVSFRIRKQYFDDILNGFKKYELRSYTRFWIDRLLCVNPPEIAVFVCGKRVHRREIKDIAVGRPDTYLHRPLSDQGKLDVSTEECIAVELGDALCRDCGGVLHMSDVYDAIQKDLDGVGDPDDFLKPWKRWVCRSCGYSENRGG